MIEEINLKMAARMLLDEVNQHSENSSYGLRTYNLSCDDAYTFEEYSFKEKLAILKQKIRDLSIKISE